MGGDAEIGSSGRQESFEAVDEGLHGFSSLVLHVTAVAVETRQCQEEGEEAVGDAGGDRSWEILCEIYEWTNDSSEDGEIGTLWGSGW